jgi:hypothetical protein
MISVITTMRSPSWISAAGRQFICGHYLGAPYQDNDSGSSSVAAKRKSSFEGDKSASYVIPDDATADIISAT